MTENWQSAAQHPVEAEFRHANESRILEFSLDIKEEIFDTELPMFEQVWLDEGAGTSSDSTSQEVDPLRLELCVCDLSD